jgi:NADPH:quinone reductase-like Zn-dependent oxidoreductase
LNAPLANAEDCGAKQPILGTELAGVVESVGKDVRNFKVGNQVFAFSDAAMGNASSSTLALNSEL